jgi:hypothetical protein
MTMTPDEMFGAPDPDTVRRLEYVAASHYVRTSLFARLKGNPHRSALAANCIWAGGHHHRELGLPDDGVQLAVSTLEKQRQGWERLSNLDDSTIESLLKAARGCSAKAPTSAGADVAKRVLGALLAITKSRKDPPLTEAERDRIVMRGVDKKLREIRAQASQAPAPLAHSQPSLAPQGGAPAAAAKPVSRILNRETGKVFETVACGAGFDAFFEIKLENGEPMYELVTSSGDVNET